MIGQKKLIELIDSTPKENLARFIIIHGGRGSGKKTLLKKVASKIGMVANVDKGVDAVREMIKSAYDVNEPILYHIQNSEQMSAQAMNSLLKVVEEPPRKAYFAITVSNMDNILPTIKSRSMVFNMLPYSKEDIMEFLQVRYGMNPTDANVSIIADFCENMGEVDYLLSLDSIENFYKYVKLVFNKVGASDGVDAFRISNKMKFKEDAVGYEPLFFLKCLAIYGRSCMKIEETIKHNRSCAKAIQLIANCRSELQIKSINKAAAFDAFILQLRIVRSI